MSDQKCVALTDCGDVSETESYIRQLEKELTQAQKLEEIGMVAGVVAHDLNNILTPIFGYSTILKRDMDKDHPLAKAVGVIEKSAERAALLVGKLLGCSRQLEAVKTPFAVAKTLDAVLDSLNGKAVTLEKRFADVPLVLGDAHQIAMVIRAVIDNALEAIETGGKIAVAVDTVDLDDVFCKHHPPTKPGVHVCIAIVDDGHGMLPEVMARAFEPFFSTKTIELCAGIGLTLAHTITRKHCGCVTLESVPGKGTTAKIYLPAIKD
ncbi:hypothetical protein KI809_06805 [Geobacter pelophilus]|uniref:histidine kinase n=1 Tax=Geoanaerobacter pelophilus TaxID=60036 RepID=A0AAW4KZD3_9BACT|nr:ATP-binding protein [Geoanaerobacter pelophilus]MBT0664008.1 hypothetical protein [Geoanaerobacter pelophilus]